jgi:biopolymer transport protein ExbB
MYISKNLKTALASMFFALAWVLPAMAAGKEARYIPDVEAEYAGMTMWQVIVAGGGVMVVLALLSIAAVSLIAYYFLTMRQAKLLPQEFIDKIINFVETGRVNEAIAVSKPGENMAGRVFHAGISKVSKGPIVVREAIEDEGKREIDSLWRKLSYLADIAAIAPMVGLLGTVLGMIQAFNVIAFQAGAVKPVLLASGISKAMVTTAGGLIIAIPAMIFYSYFRGIVETVAARLENVATEFSHLIIRKTGQGGLG